MAIPKTYIETVESDLPSITQAIEHLLDRVNGNLGDMPAARKRRIVARALVSNVVIEEINNQIQFLITGE